MKLIDFKKYNKFVVIFFISMIILLAAMPFFGYFKKAFWLFDIFIHFKIHYIYGLVFFGLIALSIRKFFITLFAVFSIILSLSFIQPLQFKLNSKPAPYIKDDKSVRVMFFNIDYFNKKKDGYVEYFKKVAPDILILVEAYPDDYARYKNILTEYVYSNYSDVNEEEPLNGIAMFSKIKPLDDIKFIHFGKGTCPTVSITFKINNKEVEVVGTHPFSPINKRRTLGRDKQLVELSNYFKNNLKPRLLIGDFNTTVWLPEFKDLISKAGFINSMDKFGLQTTWPSILPDFLRITIDHALYTNEIILLNKIIGPNLGSDHLPVVADFSVN